MDIRKVKKLIELLEESQIGEIEIHEGEESVRISRQGAPGSVPVQSHIHVPEAAPRGGEASEPRPETVPEEEEQELEGQPIRSPMVGLFYEAPSPGKPPFVEVGQEVKEGDVVCIIEAMKIMNQIESEVSGVISRILVENGEPVEYGQPLFIVKES
jgi:acetyl-CoA carboxylase biotin carboxyl carrier protein